MSKTNYKAQVGELQERIRMMEMVQRSNEYDKNSATEELGKVRGQLEEAQKTLIEYEQSSKMSIKTQITIAQLEARNELLLELFTKFFLYG